jgi:hypothetical protein
LSKQILITYLNRFGLACGFVGCVFDRSEQEFESSIKGDESRVAGKNC